MTKTVWRFFGGFLDTQEQWLNAMAEQGWRLTENGRLTYRFTPCQPGAYQYAVEFVAHQSSTVSRDYQIFLEDLGYRVWRKNINLNLSFGKVRLRPYGEGRGKVAVSGGTYGQELFIVEKVSDGRPFTLHTTREDCAAYYKRQRGAYSTICLLWLAGAALLAAQSSWGGAAVLGLLGGVFALGWVNCQRRLGRIKRKGMLME